MLIGRKELLCFTAILLLLGGGIGYYASGGPSPNPNPSQIGSVWTGTDLYPTGHIYLGAGGVDVNPILEHPETEASYIIWPNDPVTPTLYYAKDGTTGTVTSNANLTPLISGLIANQTAFTFKAGAYTIGTITLTGYYGVSFLGEVYPYTKTIGTILTLASGTNSDMFKATSGGSFSFTNLILKGNKGLNTWGFAINFDSVDAVHVENVNVFEFKGAGIVIIDGAESVIENVVSRDNDDDGLYILQENSVIRDCVTSHNLGNGFTFSWKGLSVENCIAYLNNKNGFNVATLVDSTFVSCRSWANDFHGFNIVTSENNAFMSCLAASNSNAANNTYYGMKIDNSNGTRVIGGEYCSNTLYWWSIQQHGIKDDGVYAVNNKIYGAIGYGNNAENFYVFNAGDRITDCVGFIDINSGSTTIASGTTSANVTHGLGYVPDANDIICSYGENPTNDAGSLYWDNFTAFQFTVHCLRDPGASNLDIVWSARRTP